MSYLKVASLLLCLSAMYGCATVTRGTTDVLVIETEPAGADVEIQPAMHICKTPCSVKLKRRHEQVVSIRREGYEPVEVAVIPKIVGAGAAGVAGNVLVGGIIGAMVDAGTGAARDLTPNPIKVNLVVLKPVPPADSAIVPGNPEQAIPAGTAETMFPPTSGTSH